MSNTSIVHPFHYLIVKREITAWRFKPGDKIFYNPTDKTVAMNLKDKLASFHLTPASIMIELFRLNGGKAGYYLVNLRDKKYYYCGYDWHDINATLCLLKVRQLE